jgi:cytidine deaminase
MPPADALMDAAREARSRAYAPYSGFTVGAALQTQDGTIVTGCNVENASYGLAICAERVAFARAIAQGHRHFSALAIAGPDGVDAPPCGACRQFAAEFAPALTVSFTARDSVVRTTIDRLLPEAFTRESLQR